MTRSRHVMAAASAVEAWVSFFTELYQLLTTADRNFGICNLNMAEYVVERLELSIHSCSNLVMLFQTSNVALSNDELAVANEYRTLVDKLLSYLRESSDKWKYYMTVLERSSARDDVSYQSSVTHSNGRRGRPKFEVSREQVEYLASLSFQWTEIAALLCISRMTLYRYICT